MELRIDLDRLRRDLMESYGTAAFSGLPGALIPLSQAQSGPTEDVIRLALEAGLDLNDYRV